MKEPFKYKYDDLFNPTLKAVRSLGGSATGAEIEEEVARILKLTKREVNAIHKGSRTKLNYRLAWAKNYLKRSGLLENSSRGVWALTQKGIKTKSINKDDVKKAVKAKTDKTVDAKTARYKSVPEVEDAGIRDLKWQDKLLDVLQRMEAGAFERLAQRVLRELGFANVQVTGRSGDGGIDGKGVLKLGGVLSFHVAFQCKRYRGSVAPSLVRSFRGAMMGRADKGLLITTGTFTREAKKEAQREGASPIDLVDGYELVNKLRELGLGIQVRSVEEVIVNKDWFDSI